MKRQNKVVSMEHITVGVLREFIEDMPSNAWVYFWNGDADEWLRCRGLERDGQDLLLKDW